MGVPRVAGTYVGMFVCTVCTMDGCGLTAVFSLATDRQEEEPFRLEVESKYFDSCFYIKKPACEPTENPFREADYADYSDKGLAH